MNPPCGRCNKPVYPTEKINCLDKYWHKGCFSCEVCKMALSMTTYKGFEKKPYCSMHYPKTSFTIVTDTPENLRLKQQSMLNSQALYKEEFEKSKGKGFSVVADTPEMQRVKKTQDQISHALYKEEFEKNKGKGFSVVADTPEMQRVKKTQDQISNIKYHEEFEKSRIRSDAPPPENRQYEDEVQPSNPGQFSQPVRQMRPVAAPVAPSGGAKRYQALYSYTAAEADEVSLAEGDLILDVETIDEGWMFGCNQRTGQRGLLPANYVRPV